MADAPMDAKTAPKKNPFLLKNRGLECINSWRADIVPSQCLRTKRQVQHMAYKSNYRSSQAPRLAVTPQAV